MCIASCMRTSKLSVSGPTVNSKAALKKPYVILISLDGFRWDYVERFAPPHLSTFIKNGVGAESLIPSFPSKTFPNHYTIATGMYPDNHGIIDNTFYSYEKEATYSISNRAMVQDGSFYGGSPIWVQADKADVVSASYFFVGSEADVQGRRPTYYFPYDHNIKNEVRVKQTLDWLTLPAKKRPHIITLYFSDMDDIGHRFGPNNDEELGKTLLALDNNLGDLFAGVDATGLPVNIIIVSDHGMTEIKNTDLIPIEKIEEDSLYSIANDGAMVHVYPKDNVPVDAIYHFLQEKELHFKVYKTENAPGFEYKPMNKNWGAIQIIPDYGYYFSTLIQIELKKKNPTAVFGVHGYDTDHKDMHGIFYAKGPAFKKGVTIPSVKNIHVYPLMCEILDLEVPNNIDGTIDQLENVLNSSPHKTSKD